jgi:ATP-binding cassette subfamily G (WHITE) protein 2
MVTRASAFNKLPIKLTWDDLNLAVDVVTKNRCKSTHKTLNILKGVSGYAMPGTTTFIMGASGCGKTSLLNLMSDRVGKTFGRTMTGTIMFNDQIEVNQKSFGQVGSYVMQDDLLFEYFTVKEALTFAARLRLTIPEEEQDKRVQDLLQELGLVSV